jgi:hypothetical protein
MNAYPPLGLEIDTANGFMYWSNNDEDKIQRSNLDGSGITDIVSGFESRDIVLNSETGYLYASSADTIKQIVLDGSVSDIVTNLGNPFGLSIDYKNDFLYWTDSSTGKIQRSNYDGSDVIDIVTEVSFPRGIDVAPDPDLTVDDILNFFDDCVAAGTIDGRGRKPWIANARLWLFGQMLETAQSHLENGRTNRACRTLNSIVRRCDGEPWPRDYIEGEAVPELYNMILDLMEIECE